MSRSLTATNAGITDDQWIEEILLFVQLEFDSGTLYLHTGLGSITTLSQTWLGVGDFGAIDVVEEGNDVIPYQLNLVLSGVDSTLLNEALTADFQNRDVTIYIGFLQDGALADTPEELWSGQMDNMTVRDGDDASIQLRCESHLKRFDAENGMLYTDNDLQARYSGDLFFQYLPQMEDVTLTWGGNTIQFRPGATNGAFPNFTFANIGQFAGFNG